MLKTSVVIGACVFTMLVLQVFGGKGDDRRDDMAKVSVGKY